MGELIRFDIWKSFFGARGGYTNEVISYALMLELEMIPNVILEFPFRDLAAAEGVLNAFYLSTFRK